MDLKSDGKTLGIIIIMIIFFVSLIIIIDELYNITKFAYRYTYLYNYGKMNENTCSINIIEYETARFRIYNEINKYKLEKDLYNKTWINYLQYISILTFAILLSISFGYLFYNLFVSNNEDCIETDINNMSFIKQILQCICADCHIYIPNCFLNYLMVFFLILVYPLIYLLKVGLNYDLTWNSGFTKRIVHICVFLTLVYYIYVLYLQEPNDYGKLIVYIVFIIIFYFNNYIFTKTYDEFNNVTKIANLYYTDDENELETDTMFYDIYKQEEPVKPLEVALPCSVLDTSSNCSNLLDIFTYCTNSNVDFNNSSNLYCYKFKDVASNIIKYELDKETIEKYYENKKRYANDLEIYETKNEIYKNNKTEFPETVYLLYTMIPQLTSIDKREIQILCILLIIIIIIYNNLKTVDEDYANYIYYTAFLYIIGVLTIMILINAIVNYNTFFNKYLIYEPIHNYKNSLNNKNTIFNLLVNQDETLKNFYSKINKDINFNNYSLVGNLNFTYANSNINNFKNKITLSTDTNTKPDIVENPILEQVRINTISVFYSDIYKNIRNNTDEVIAITYDYNKMPNLNLDDYKKVDNPTLKILIKNLLLSDDIAINNRIEQLRLNYKYFTYNTNIKSTNFYITADNYTNKQIGVKPIIYGNDITKTDDFEINYKNNLFLFEKSLVEYKEFLIEFRKIIIEMFNGITIACDNTNFINVDDILNDFMTIINKIKDNSGNNIQLIKAKIIDNYITNINEIITRYINIIKVYVRLYSSYSQANSSNNTKTNLMNILINNYNLYANDLKKHSANALVKLELKIKSNFIASKYNSYKSNDYKKLNMNTNNVSWAFVILIIIFTIILLEPLII